MDILDLCKAGKSAEVLELLKSHGNCKMDRFDDEGDTALIWACCNNMKEVALELLKYPDKCKIDQVNAYNDTALIWACCKNMKEVALELLKYPDACKIDQINNKGSTALIRACCKGMKEVALELLKYPDKCKMDQINNEGNTALIWAHKNNMTDIVSIIQQHVDIFKIVQVSEAHKDLLCRYFDKKTTEKISELSNKEEIQMLQKELNDVINKVKNLAKDGECLMCCEKTNNNIFLTKCKHVLCVCSECSSSMDKKCPVCRTNTPFIGGCFTV